MGKIVTTEEFIQRAKKTHGYRYDYSKSVYTKSHNKIKIICPVHGLFRQKANGHLNGSGCFKCGIERGHLQQQFTTEDFINKSKKTHKNKYNYHNSIYKGSESKVKIDCPIHGIFEQFAGEHMKRAGCPHCAHKRIADMERMTKNRFIIRSNKIHKNKYNYCKVNYKNNRTKVMLVCPKHGEFFVTPDSHFHGCGCRKCKKERIYNRYQIRFIKRANKIHHNFYDYSEVMFMGHKKKIKIICPKHGSFFQLVDTHLRGSGCSRCILKQEYKLEKIIKKIFRGWRIKRHKKLYSKEHNRYRYFDFFIKKDLKKIIIEYDGKQHFKPVRFSNKMSQEKADIKFEKQKITDRFDVEFCKRKGIRLFRVHYNVDMVKFIEKIKLLFQ